MSAATFNTISIVGFAIAAVFFILAVVLFFVFDIVALIGEVSGRTAAKQVQELREQSRRVTTRRREPVLTTEHSSKAVARDLFTNNKPVTEQIGTALLVEEEGTALLAEEEGTALLVEEEGTALLAEEEGTVLLAEEEEGTTVLSEEAQESGDFRLLEEATSVHTDEYISI